MQTKCNRLGFIYLSRLKIKRTLRCLSYRSGNHKSFFSGYTNGSTGSSFEPSKIRIWTTKIWIFWSLTASVLYSRLWPKLNAKLCIDFGFDKSKSEEQKRMKSRMGHLGVSIVLTTHALVITHILSHKIISCTVNSSRNYSFCQNNRWIDGIV